METGEKEPAAKYSLTFMKILSPTERLTERTHNGSERGMGILIFIFLFSVDFVLFSAIASSNKSYTCIRVCPTRQYLCDDGQSLDLLNLRAITSGHVKMKKTKPFEEKN